MFYKINVRRLWRIRSSLAMTLPKDFCDYHKLQERREVTLLQFEDFILVLPVRVKAGIIEKLEEIAKSKQVEELAKLVKNVVGE